METYPLIPPQPGRKLFDLALHEANSIQTDSYLSLVYRLSAFNAALNGKFMILAPNGHSQPNSLYFLIVGDSGERKSESAKNAKKPIIDWLLSQRDKFEKIEIKRRHLKRRIKNLHKQAEKANEFEAQQYLDKVADLQKLLRLLSQGFRFFSDATSPALKQILDEGTGRISIIEPEGGLCHLLMRKNADVTLFNNAYDGEPLQVDRVTTGSFNINDPLFSICIAAQPGLTMEFLRNKRLRDSGLHGRFIYVKMQSRAGKRAIQTPSIPAELLDWYTNKIISFLNLCPEKDDAGVVKPFRLKLNAEASIEYIKFRQLAEDELNPGGKLSFCQSWGSKLPGKALRLAGLLHCIECDNPFDQDISASTMLQAIHMAYVFTEHAQCLYFQADHGKFMDCGNDIMNWASKSLLSKTI